MLEIKNRAESDLKESSNIPSIDKFPKAWAEVPNKSVLRLIKKCVGEDYKSYQLLTLGLKGIRCRNVESGKGKFPASFETYQVVEPNDLVFCLFDIDETPRTVGYSKLKGMITGAYSVFRCQPDVSTKFIFYYYLSIDNHKSLKPFYSGLRKTVRPPKFLGIKLPLPSYEEQQAIANFLDRETARIDDLIKKQERLIELLDEKRVSLINQAVTKGLDPNIPMKDSGIEWLGEVPSHWEIKKIKQVSRLISKGSTPTTIGEGFSAEGVKFIKAENISKGRVSSQPEFYISDETNQMMKRSILLDGDVLVVIAGATIGKAATVLIDDLPANTNQAVSFIRPIDKTISKFLNYWITSDSIKVQILLSAVQSAQPNLSMESLGNLNLVQPPEDEVLRITDFLDFETAKLDQLKQKASKCIELLKEYKTSLISSAVTGKIDVRNYKSSDPINN